MSRPKEPPDKISSEENPFFPQWTTFEWENITDNMRRAIEKTARSPAKVSNSFVGLESLHPNTKCETQVCNLINDISKLREISQGRFFDPSEILQEIRSPPDHPSQLVDALKVGLADILLGSETLERDGSDDEFSKSSDISYDAENCNTDIFETDNVSTTNRIIGSSAESEDDITDHSTTESISRESLHAEPSADKKTASSEDLQRQPEGNQASLDSSPNRKASQSDCKNVNVETKSNTELVSEEEPPNNSSSDFEVVEKDSFSSTDTKQEDIKADNDNDDLPNAVSCSTASTAHDQPGEMEACSEHYDTDDSDSDSWKKDITIEDINFIDDKDDIKETLKDSAMEARAKNDKAVTGHYHMRTQPPPNNYSPESLKKSYAEVLKKGLKPDAVTFVKPLTFALCCQQGKVVKVDKETKQKTPKKSASKEKRAKRADSQSKKESITDSTRRRSPMKATSPVKSRAKASPGKDSAKDTSKSPSRKLRRKLSFDQNDSWKNNAVSSESSVSDDPSAVETLRKKIKAEQIAKVLQDAKLTLAKLTTESLGSYEKVSCLKQVPSANNDTFKALQSQEINKAKHMKELANHLHELTQMGLGNAKEFSEIKDILISLHYLQTKDKYFVEKMKGKSAEKTSRQLSKHKGKDTGVQLFVGLSLMAILFMVIFKRHWFIIICIVSLFVFYLFNQQKMFNSPGKSGRSHKKQNK